MTSATVPTTVPTGVSTASRTEPDAVAAGRSRIDAIDAELLDLVRQRLAVSREIQLARMAAGGPQVVHAREGEVVDRWREALGPPGSRIALALLELSRGPVSG